MQKSAHFRTLVTLTALSLVPALAIEFLIALTRTAFDRHTSSLLAETAGGITWALLVCFGVAAGSALSHVSESVAGAIAFVATPLALVASKAAQGGVSELLGQTSPGLPPGLALVAAVKACEYGTLAYVLSRLAHRGVHAVTPHLGVGVAIAASFGTALVAIATMRPEPNLAAPEIATTAINEFLFPLGCVLVVLLTRASVREATPKLP
jgi:hypothetical protein